MKTSKNQAVRCAAWFFIGLSLQAAPVTQLKVMSFNVWVQGGLSLSNCIEVIRNSGADLVGLQECNATTAQTIGSGLGFFVQPDGDSSIVSRYPILASIPTSGGRGATIELGPGQRVHLFNCHLAPYPYGPYDLQAGQSQSFIVNQEHSTRMPAMNSLLSAMSPYLASAEPCFLTGDFNAPSHFDYTSFPWPTSIACTNAGLGDSYAETHPGNRKYPVAFAFDEPGITWTPKTNQEPNGVFDRIDFVHYSKGDGLTVTSSVELDERNSINPWPSDHRAVLSMFTLTPPVLAAKASAPIPSNNATNVSLSPTLYWLPGSNATSHAIYLGTNAPSALLANQTGTSLPLTNLLANTLYHWRVDESTPGGLIVGDVWTFTTKNTNEPVYEWTFDNGDLSPALGNGLMAYADGFSTASLVIFGTTDGSFVPHINGKPAEYIYAHQFMASGNGFHVTFSETGPNGGGTYINQFTIIFDVLLPAPINWFPFFNTNPANANDADFYVNDHGALGIGAIGYSANGLIAANTWYRVAFVADLAASTVTYYLNGNPVHSGGAPLDGRHSLYSNADAGPDLLLFNESFGVFTHDFYLNSFYFTGRVLSGSEILALGGPNARGIGVPSPPLKASISWQGPTVLLSWAGGEGPYQVRMKNALTDPSWQNVGAPTNGTNLVVLPNGAAAFYQIVGQ